jgi:hypothetical protein
VHMSASGTRDGPIADVRYSGRRMTAPRSARMSAGLE